MNNLLYNQIKLEIENSGIKYLPSAMIEDIYLTVVYIKYLCDNETNDFKYDEIVKMSTKELFAYLNSKSKPFIKDPFLEEINIPKLIHNIEFENIDNLITHLTEKKEVNSINNILTDSNDKILLTGSYKLSKNYQYLNNITYLKTVENIYSLDDSCWKIYDIILNNNNNYISKINNNVLKKFNTIMIYDDSLKYLFKQYKNSLFKFIYDIIYDKNFNGKIILKARYSNISILKNISLLNKLDKVILNSDKNNEDTYLIFNSKKESDKISFILYDENSKLNYKSIIEKNKQNKNYLIKVTSDEIKQNNYILGFNIYKNKDNETNINIRDIIDQNIELINKIDDLNIEIANEINKIFVK